MKPLLAGALLLLALPISAEAAPPPGTDLNSPLHQWFENQYSINGAWCCNVADGHILKDGDWRITGTEYEVRIEGVWMPVPPHAMRDPKGGPNPTGAAIVWYIVTDKGVVIFCFAPGFES